MAAPSPISLIMMKPRILGGGPALALQVKVVALSAVLRGSKVRVLMNDSLEPVAEEMVTLASLLDKRVLPLSHVISTPDSAITISVVGLMEMLQVRVRGVIRPANSGPRGTIMITSGVETGRKDDNMLRINITIRILWPLYVHTMHVY